MEFNEKIMAIAKEFGLEAEQDEYTGTNQTYIIFTQEDEVPKCFGDNQPESDLIYIMLQIITPKKEQYIPLKNKLRKELEKEGFMVTSVRSFLGDTYHGTTKLRQTILEMQYLQEREEE